MIFFQHKEPPSLGCHSDLLNPVDYSHDSGLCSLPSPSLEHYIDVPIDYPMVFIANVNLGYENNEFDVLGGNANNFVSLGCFRGCDPSIDPYCVCLGDFPKKITWTAFFNPSYDFSKAINKVKRILLSLL